LCGDGSSGNPFQVSNATELYDLRNCPDSKYFIQITDIDLDVTPYNTGDGWLPIGNSDYGFIGFYDGQNHTIDGLFINRPITDCVGLFGSLQSSAIQNLGVTNVNITGNMFVGGLVGFLIESSSVSNCFSTGIVNGYHSCP